jgi:hypothetical protein
MQSYENNFVIYISYCPNTNLTTENKLNTFNLGKILNFQVSRGNAQIFL